MGEQSDRPRVSGLLEASSVRFGIQMLPLLLNKLCCWRCIPSDAGITSCASSCSGDPAVSLVPCMRCDVRVADLQVAGTLVDLVGSCQ